MARVNLNTLSFEEQLAKEASKVIAKEASKLKEDLVAATPVDTGRAAASWSVTTNANGDVSIENSVPYIEKLNEGSSPQAAPHFIESEALRYGRVRGYAVRFS